MQAWDSTYVPKGARNYLTQRYERMSDLGDVVVTSMPMALR